MLNTDWCSSLFIPEHLLQVFLPWRALKDINLCLPFVLLKPRGGARLQRKGHKTKPNKLQNFHNRDVIMERDSQRHFPTVTSKEAFWLHGVGCSVPPSANISILTPFINEQTCVGLENSSACSGGRAHLPCTDAAHHSELCSGAVCPASLALLSCTYCLLCIHLNKPHHEGMNLNVTKPGVKFWYAGNYKGNRQCAQCHAQDLPPSASFSRPASFSTSDTISLFQVLLSSTKPNQPSSYNSLNKRALLWQHEGKSHPTTLLMTWQYGH